LLFDLARAVNADRLFAGLMPGFQGQRQVLLDLQRRA